MKAECTSIKSFIITAQMRRAGHVVRMWDERVLNNFLKISCILANVRRISLGRGIRIAKKVLE